jgi:hypothetical protein
MGWIASAALALLVAAQAIQRIRADRRRGLPIDWPKTLVTLAGVALAAIGLLIGALAADRPALAAADRPCGESVGRPFPHTSTFSAAMNASCGMSTLPNWRIFFLPAFCFSSSLRLRVASPP